MTREQVEAMIQKKADETGRTNYNWKQSIVDLMKLLDLDSSLNARKELAKELGYTGALDGSAEMNIWLHKQVMAKLMESGGTVPDEPEIAFGLSHRPQANGSSGPLTRAAFAFGAVVIVPLAPTLDPSS